MPNRQLHHWNRTSKDDKEESGKTKPPYQKLIRSLKYVAVNINSNIAYAIKFLKQLKQMWLRQNKYYDTYVEQ